MCARRICGGHVCETEEHFGQLGVFLVAINRGILSLLFASSRKMSSSGLRNVHSSQFRRGTAGNFLDAELTQLGLELVELFLQVVLVLPPELAGLDFCVVRLFPQFVSFSCAQRTRAVRLGAVPSWLYVDLVDVEICW